MTTHNKQTVFKTHYNHLDVKSKGETFKEKSLTIPDQTMTVQEILKRYASGMSLTAGKVPLYASDDNDDEDLSHIDGINIHTLDIAEKQRLQRESSETVKKFEDGVRKNKAKAERSKLEKEIEKELEKKFKKDGAGSGLPEQPAE